MSAGIFVIVGLARFLTSEDRATCLRSFPGALNAKAFGFRSVREVSGGNIETGRIVTYPPCASSSPSPCDAVCVLGPPL